MIRISIIRIALFAIAFLVISTALDTAFGFEVTFAKQALSAVCATLGWMLAVKWIARRSKAGGAR